MELPKGAIICGAINPENELYDVNTMDAALKDRFEIFEVNYDKKIFMEYMENSKWDESIRLFIESNTWLYSKPEDVGNVSGTKYISPRTFSKLNAARKSDLPKDMEVDIYESILGKNVGRSFFQFVTDEQPVLYSDLVKNKSKSLKKLQSFFSDPKNYKAGHIAITIKDIVERKEIEDDLLADVLLNIPADVGPSLIQNLEYERKEAAGTILDRIIKNYPKVHKYLKEVLNK